MKVCEEVGSYDAKTKLPEILRKVAKGSHFTITKRGKPVADLVPTQATNHARTLEAIEDILKIQGVAVSDDVLKSSIENGRK